MDLIDCTIRVIRDEHQACYLARNCDATLECTNADDDPMLHVHALRLHLYRDVRIQKVADNFTRFKLLDVLDDFTQQYRSLLKLASTPLPFPMIQMARTFLFLWTFSIPFVLRGVINEIYVGMIFVFFLTYGFIGLEIVSMKLMFPFGACGDVDCMFVCVCGRGVGWNGVVLIWNWEVAVPWTRSV
jgi:predicted membrane chloride channel (bestrophin family)